MENVRIATSDCVLIDFPGFITADLKSKFTLDEDENLTFTHKGTQMMASIQQTHNILIKLHKIRRSNGEVRYRFVGKLIRKTYRFNFLCDYHLSSNDPMNSIFHSAYHPSLEKLPIIRPPYFTMSRWGYEYLYKENPAIKHGEKANHTFISILADAEPPSTNYKLPSLEPKSKSVQEIFAKLQTLFNERPVWTRVKLASILGINTKNILLLKALPYIGYAFKCGPFRSCVIRFGFDPRKDYANRIYQVINLRLPGMGARVRNDIQICDIENPDPALERLLTSLLFCKPDFDSRDGFFVEGHLAKVKEHLAQRAKDTEVVDASENVNAAQDELLNEFEDMDDFDLLFE